LFELKPEKTILLKAKKTLKKDNVLMTNNQSTEEIIGFVDI